MAQGDITKEIENDRIEVVLKWNIQIWRATKLMEEQADGSKKEMTRTFHRHTLVPFSSSRDSDGNWTHTETDLDKIAEFLIKKNYTIYSTGGSSEYLKKIRVKVTNAPDLVYDEKIVGTTTPTESSII